MRLPASVRRQYGRARVPSRGRRALLASTTVTESVTLSAPSRIHLGFLDPDASLGRRFASLGLVIDGFDTRVQAYALPAGASENRIEVADPQLDDDAHARIGRHLATLQQESGRSQPIGIRLLNAPPAHSGFGSGTQLALAVGRAFCLLHGLETDSRRLAELLGRGLRSGVGLAGFERGGLLLDGGPGAAGQPAPLLARIEFPQDWRVLLVLDPRLSGLSGGAERAALASLPPFSQQDAAALCHQVLMRILPAAAEADFESFANGISFVQSLIGDYFAPAQGGSMYTSAAVGRLLEWLRTHHVAGIGQSSWGPTGFAILPSQAAAEAVLDEARAAGALDPALHVVIVRGRNRGAEISRRAASK